MEGGGEVRGRMGVGGSCNNAERQVSSSVAISIICSKVKAEA